MAGFFAAAAKTPISTIIMVSELTGNYELLMPSMWVCTISFLVARKWSIYQSQVPARVYSQAHFGEYIHDIFSTITVKEAYIKSKNLTVFFTDTLIKDIQDTMVGTSQRLFPVSDRENNLAGTFYLKDIASHFWKSDSKTVADIMRKEILKIYPNDTIDQAQEKMLKNMVEELVVTDESENQEKLLGIITASEIMKAYNRELNLLRFGKEMPQAFPGDKLLLKQLNLNKVLEKGLLTVNPDASLGDLIKIFIRSKRNIFPVVDQKRQYFGMVYLNDIRELMFDAEKYKSVKIKDIMSGTTEILYSDDNMIEVINKFDRTHAWNLPVVDRRNRYMGVVSQSTLFASYRNQLLYQIEI